MMVLPHSFKSESSSALTLMLAWVILAFMPVVLATCIDETVTETAWITVTAAPGVAPIPSVVSNSSVASTGVPHSSVFTRPTPVTSASSTLYPSESGSSSFNTSIVSSASATATTSSNMPPLSSGNPNAIATATYNPLPKPAPAVFAAPETFNQLNPMPNQGSIRNSCGYDVYVWSVGCSDTATNVKIAAGTTWSEPLRRCPNGGVVYKVSKTAGDNSKVMQFEAGVWANKDIVQYDLSYLNCMVPNTTDLSACAGWEGGHQAVPGKGCQVFVCNPGEYCDGSSYTVAEFGYQAGGITHPNAGCAASKGIAFELCACSKA